MFGHFVYLGMSQIKTVLPMKPYLRKWMGCFVKVQPSYQASLTDSYGRYLYMLMNDKYKYPHEKVPDYKDKIIVEIPELWLNLGRLDLSNEKVKMFNLFVDNMFYQQFYMWMDIYISIGSRMDIARQLYCQQYGLDLDIDINDETLKKRYDRFCENRTAFINPFKNSNGKPRQQVSGLMIGV